jgi:4-amino-4-deoxy-L-arabinose transferase-like glycosyltransferase
VTTTLDDTQPLLQSRMAAASIRIAAVFEAMAVLASPGVLYVVLRLRGMAPAQLPDPSMHTTFIIDPRDIFTRYQVMFAPSSRLREAARVGFLVPARVAYLLFGAVPGFFVFRYVLALIAIVPVYLLLKKVYGRWAGFVGIAVVMSSPVLITAWGTDYPDSATVSYLTGGFAALALSWEGGRWRLGWLVGGGVLLTMAVWSLGVSVPLVVVLVAVYLAMRLRRERPDLGRDLALLVASAILATGLLAICSKLLLGTFNFITPTVDSARLLSKASEVRADHSASWSWAPYDPYLLVPPAIVASFFVVFARRRGRNIGTTQLFVGVTGALQLAAFAYLQFIGNFQDLEMHYFSSVLWSSVTIMLAMTLAELARPFLESGVAAGSDRGPERRAAEPARLLRWIAGAVPGLLVLAVALVYEIAYRAGLTVPAMTWAPWGAPVAAIVVAGAVLGRLTIEWTKPEGDRRGAALLTPRCLVSAGAIVVMTAAALILTVAPQTPHAPLANTVYDPPPAYAQALDGNDTTYVDQYTVLSELPGFVGHPQYQGEVLLTWEPNSEFGDLLGPMGIYHNAFTWVSETFPVLNRIGVRQIRRRQAAQVLIMSLTGQDFAHAVKSLARFQPAVVRRTILSDGTYHLHAWLVDLRRYLRGASVRRHARSRPRVHGHRGRSRRRPG